MNAATTGGRPRGRNPAGGGWSAVERRDLRAAEEIAVRRCARTGRRSSSCVSWRDPVHAGSFPGGDRAVPRVFEKARTSGAGYHLGYCYLAENDSRRAREILEQWCANFRRWRRRITCWDFSGPRVEAWRGARALRLRHRACSPACRSPQQPGERALRAGPLRGGACTPGEGDADRPCRRSVPQQSGQRAFQAGSNRRSDRELPQGGSARAGLRRRAQQPCAACRAESRRGGAGLLPESLGSGSEASRCAYHMGLAYQGLNRFEEAIECHEKALASNRTRPKRTPISVSSATGRSAGRRRSHAIAARSP